MLLSAIITLISLNACGAAGGWFTRARRKQPAHTAIPHAAVAPVIADAASATEPPWVNRESVQAAALSTLAESLTDAILIVDTAGRIVYRNSVSARFDAHQLPCVQSGVHTPTPTCPAHRSDSCPLRQALAGHNTEETQPINRCEIDTPDGRICVTARPLLDDRGSITGAMAFLRDDSDARCANNPSHASEERYALALQASNNGLWDWDLLTDRVFYSARWKAMAGYADPEIGDSPTEWFRRIHPDDQEVLQIRLTAHLRRLISTFEHEYRLEHRDGAYRWMACRGIAVWNDAGVAIRIIGSQVDITSYKLAEQRLLHSALHDHLTGLANRSLLLERLGQAIQRHQRQGQPFALLSLDLDHFKVINDSLGHQAGDEMLVEVARRLERCTPSATTIARLSGDEFTILLEHTGGMAGVEAIAACLLRGIAEPMIIDGNDVYTSASIGIVFPLTPHTQRAGDLLRDAGTALYQAKQQGRSRYVTFDSSMHDRALIRLRLDSDLRHAVERNELRVHYQPIVDLATRRIAGFEALVRWQHPQRGLIAPAEFIPLAEETGMIKAIGQWVLYESCRQLSIWQRAYPLDPPLTMNVNLSPRQFSQHDLVQTVSTALNEHVLSPESLKLEITESALIEHADDATALLYRLNSLGIQLCIDDFGTGYSSLSYLQNFPFSTIKLDKSFIRQMSAGGEAIEIVRTIIALARSLGMSLVAEGTETAEQLNILQELACDYGQGWIFARALDATAAAKLIEQRHLLRTA